LRHGVLLLIGFHYCSARIAFCAVNCTSTLTGAPSAYNQAQFFRVPGVRPQIYTLTTTKPPETESFLAFERQMEVTN